MPALRTEVQPNAVAGGPQNSFYRRQLCASCVTASEASRRRSVPGLPRWSRSRACSNLVTRARPVACWSEVPTWDPRGSANNQITDRCTRCRQPRILSSDTWWRCRIHRLHRTRLPATRSVTNQGLQARRCLRELLHPGNIMAWLFQQT